MEKELDNNGIEEVRITVMPPTVINEEDNVAPIGFPHKCVELENAADRLGSSEGLDTEQSVILPKL